MHARKDSYKEDAVQRYSEDIAADVEEAYYAAYRSSPHKELNTMTNADNNSSSHSSAPSTSTRSSLAALPSSFTTLLLSLLDSPAYANLTTAYLTSVFNPSTPDDPSVKYFSVAGRVNGVSVWHPLWLPKMVLDRYEDRQREKGHGAPEQAWGNDGLVTVESAKWGEFLGTLEGCDHWAIRGARGIEVDLPSISVPSLRLGLSSGTGGSADDASAKAAAAEGWSLTDWAKFVKVWKSEENEKAVARAGMKTAEEGSSPSSSAGEVSGSAQGRMNAEQADDVIKSSTDKLSAVFDWIAEQVPSPRSLPIPGLSSSAPASTDDSEPARRKAEERRDLDSKDDLERFYVALCRKLYNEGL